MKKLKTKIFCKLPPNTFHFFQVLTPKNKTKEV